MPNLLDCCVLGMMVFAVTLGKQQGSVEGGSLKRLDTTAKCARRLVRVWADGVLGGSLMSMLGRCAGWLTGEYGYNPKV